MSLVVTAGGVSAHRRFARIFAARYPDGSLQTNSTAGLSIQALSESRGENPIPGRLEL
jgi:hypothetical protein